MAVLLHCLTVIVRVSTVEEKYPGGLSAYRASCPNRTFRADPYLAAVGFMDHSDVSVWVAKLEALGFVHLRGGRSTDICVAEQGVGHWYPCDWVLAGADSRGFDVAWLVGTRPGSIAVPRGWNPEQSTKILKLEDVDVEYLGLQDGVHVYRERRTGQLVYQGSPFFKQGRGD